MLEKWGIRGNASALLLGLAVTAEAAAGVVGWVRQEVVQASGVSSLSAPAVAAGELAYMLGDARFGGGSTPGVYVQQPFVPGQPVRPVARTGEAAPNLGTSFDDASFSPGQTRPVVSPAIDRALGGVSFLATVNTPAGRSGVVFSEWSGRGTLGAVAVPGVTQVGGSNALLTVAGVPSIAFGQTVFQGRDSVGEGVFSVNAAGLPLTKWVSTGDAAPTDLPISGGSFTGFGAFPMVDWNESKTQLTTAFQASTNYLSGSSGIYVRTDLAAPKVVVETPKFLPGQNSERFASFLSPAIDDDIVAFYAEGTLGTKGIYTGTAGAEVSLVADTHTLIPGTSSVFSGFADRRGFAYPSINHEAVAFIGFDANGAPGVYANYAGALSKVFDFSDFLALFPNEQLDMDSIDLFRQGLSGNQIAFRVESFDPVQQTIRDRVFLAVAVVPVPPTWLLGLTGLAVLLLSRRRLR
ncbi:MAG TPA: hypothetical protein PKL28_17085 [Rhodocyclaceae bacterium]|nr:hypothetical protein [Rhodocyclaceae bacterium]